MKQILAKSLKQFRVHRAAKSAARRFDPSSSIIVLQMGKVGSSSVVKTIHDSDFQGEIFHLHTISRSGLTNALERIQSSAKPELDEHLVFSKALQEKILNASGRLKIITLTREPISRALSFVFQDLQRQLKSSIETAEGEAEFMKVVRQKLAVGSEHADPTSWFDRELREPFRIDVFSKPLDIESGTINFDSDVASVLLMRLENLRSEAASQALSNFVGHDCNTKRSDANIASKKKSGEKYENLVSKFRLGLEEINRISGTKYVKHFYFDRVEETRRRWAQ